MQNKKETYFKLEWIIELIRKQEPDRIDLIDQLNQSEWQEFIRRPYLRFVSGIQPNRLGSEWQFKENIVLEHEGEGTIVLDILEDGRIGGIEFVDQIPH